ncbi:eef1akmt3 [Symbiodinium natans]|uniref:Eef1akmt3 protein n=1 Tax=Symbiodinium natans TaxID=878477 RepID=A0A812T9F5_9DINO|nr:eef1akmt3 [Symbiodinium natans]
MLWWFHVTEVSCMSLGSDPVAFLRQDTDSLEQFQEPVSTAFILSNDSKCLHASLMQVASHDGARPAHDKAEERPEGADADAGEPPCRPTRSYDLLGSRVVLSEGDAALTNTGWRTWAGGWLLAKHLEDTHLEQPRRVLDLSCGTGLAGIALAKAGHEVVLCDLPMNVQTVKDNLARNRCAQCPFVERACAVGYTWGRPLPKELQQPFDVVLCGDLLYHVWSGKLQQEFLQTLQEVCCRKRPGPAIVFAGQVRSGRQENQVTGYIADHLGYNEVPVCLDPTWFRQTGSPLVADAKYRLLRLEPQP